MTWCNDHCRTVDNDNIPAGDNSSQTDAGAAAASVVDGSKTGNSSQRSCPSCGHEIKYQHKGKINDLPGLPAGVRFDPTDQELLQHLEGKVRPGSSQHSRGVQHPLIDEFIPTLEGENGICYTHPEKLPGVSKDGQVRHFFHRPSKAYTTGTRKRRKVHTEDDGSETRWHKTGKTRPVLANGRVTGYKKILVLYTNYGKQRKPEKTNWVMHQYHLGHDEEERDGELVVSKVFYQTQPRQCGSSVMNKDVSLSFKLKGRSGRQTTPQNTHNAPTEYFTSHSSIISFDQQRTQTRGSSPSTAMFPFCCP